MKTKYTQILSRGAKLVLLGLLLSHSAICGDDPVYKSVAEAGKTNAEANQINLQTPASVEKLKAEAARTWAEAQRTIAEAHLTEAKRQQVLLEMDRLRQRMRITDYEFHRVTSADYKMEAELYFINYNVGLVRPLVLGNATWKTWVGLETLMEKIGDADIITQVMFDIKVEELASSEFVPNEFGIYAEKFAGGNLGELYTFVQHNNYSIKKFGTAHKYLMKIVAMISKAGEIRMRELRDINQAIRLTIAKIE